MMDALTAIHTRVSASKLGEPAPSPSQVEALLAAAARAPDHGRIAPWQFVIIEGAARERFGELLAAAKRRQVPDAPDSMLNAERAKAMRAPMIIVVATRIVADHKKVPEIEQVLAAGAAAQNLLIAAHAMGFGSMWKTGAPAYDPEVKAALGIQAHDHIIGFIYLGTSQATVAVRPPELNGRVSRW
jgi:nitroreductase